jgi:hypothetical protein
MKLKNSRDGKKRVNLKIEVRLGAEEIAIFFISNKLANLDKQIIALAETIGERNLLDLVRREILIHGDEIPHYRVGENRDESLVQAVTATFTQRFGF